jgi:hypothetical protein
MFLRHLILRRPVGVLWATQFIEKGASTAEVKNLPSAAGIRVVGDKMYTNVDGTVRQLVTSDETPVADVDGTTLEYSGAVVQIKDSGVSTAKIADAAVTAAKLADALAGVTDGLGMLRVARATFDPSAVSGQRTATAHDLGVTIPDKGIVIGGFVDVVTTFEDGASDNATIAISVEGANDIVSAIAISNGANPWDAGKHAIIPKANTPELTGIKATAARAITATVAVHALTAGKAEIFLYYVLSA